MTNSTIKIKTPELCFDIIESIVINCSSEGASFSDLERYLKNKGMTKFSLKLYLFYLIDHGYLSYGKAIERERKTKYFVESQVYNLMHQAYEKCVLEGTTVDQMFIAFEREVKGNDLSQYR